MGFRLARRQAYLSFLLLALPSVASAGVGPNAAVEATVREYFAATPVMIEIARCESKFRQFGADGEALHGGMGSKMIGIFQIYGDIHASYAHGRGMDIDTVEGNMAYAKHLYDREGTQPWLSSYACWGAAAGSLTGGELKLGSEGQAVKDLQVALNRAGYYVAESGLGSPGNETTYFGALTRAAVRKFQCVHNIACGGDEYSSGYGLVGQRTKDALAAVPAATTPVAVQTSAPTTSIETYSPEQQAEIQRLQAQIVELTKLLAELLKSRTS